MTADENDERRRNVSVAGLAFGLATPLTYALERALEWARGEHGDPRLILRSLHTAYYWRAAVAFWWGGVIAFLVYAWLKSGRDPVRFARAIGLVAVIALPLFLFAAWRFP